MAIFKDFFSSTRGQKGDLQSQGAAHSLGGPETAPVKMNLEERMAFRRELLFDAVRATLSNHYIASGSYRFKVMRTDKRGHCFIVVIDMPPAFMTGPQGQHAQLAEIAAALTQNALAKYGLILGGVYWRVDDTLNTIVADWAKPAGMDTPAAPKPENLPLQVDDLAAFEAAWQINSAVQIGNRTYASDLAPLGDDPPRK